MKSRQKFVRRLLPSMEEIDAMAAQYNGSSKAVAVALNTVVRDIMARAGMVDTDLPEKPISNRPIRTREGYDKLWMIVAGVMRVPHQARSSKIRSNLWAESRQIYMVFMIDYSDLPLETIGQLCGGRDHSTAIHARQTVMDYYETEREYRNKIMEIDNAVMREFGFNKSWLKTIQI